MISITGNGYLSPHPFLHKRRHRFMPNGGLLLSMLPRGLQGGMPKVLLHHDERYIISNLVTATGMPKPMGTCSFQFCPIFPRQVIRRCFKGCFEQAIQPRLTDAFVTRLGLKWRDKPCFRIAFIGIRRQDCVNNTFTINWVTQSGTGIRVKNKNPPREVDCSMIQHNELRTTLRDGTTVYQEEKERAQPAFIRLISAFFSMF